ncbi:MAG: lyase [Dehalococcoidia bacterium]
MARRMAALISLAALGAATALACGGDDAPSPTPTATAGQATATATAQAAPATANATSTATASPTATVRPAAAAPKFELGEFRVTRGARPHDVAAAPDGKVWYTAQGSGRLGVLDPSTGRLEEIPLGSGSAPHGVIAGPDGLAWVTDGGLNAIVRVDPDTREVTRYPLPASRRAANLNTAAFDRNGALWFTGQSGIYGKLDIVTGKMDVFDAPGGAGPYGITATPAGDIYYASLAGSHIAKVDIETGAATRIDPPTPAQGARRVWSDSKGNIWVSEWNAGQLARYDPAANAWKEWRLPGSGPRAYAVYVDERDWVWVTDFGANAIHRFDPTTEKFDTFPIPQANAAVRQLLGRPGEVWGAESGTDTLVRIKLVE